ncbi:S-adenosyl-L-methionine-dependent methyltransferase [Elsinoe ampelina]|uniref:Arginine N-methyltransferase 2 n=1 Tax=Elsinoe ampelina TaxID=302913 RepID=A0A6A6FYT2_9PEZI|nr:S-adenosyl-L-methionine-dependent methyltransferase [Elsinoe ampelina]
MEVNVDLDTATSEILLAATNHDTGTLKTLLKTGSANVRDEDTRTTPLHAALLACEDADVNGEPQGEGDEGDAISGKALQEEGAMKTIRLLFENGAIWNDLDTNNETPGCLALRLGLKQAYELIVEAGVRAELLLNRLDEFEMLGDGDEDEDTDDGEEYVEVEMQNGHDLAEAENIPELVEASKSMVDLEADVTSARYLASELTFGGDRLLDADDNGVMMAWETDLMRHSADLLVPGEGKRVLNVGHGMGIIDGILQEKKPAEHHIIEAHPAVLERLRSQGWANRPGVHVHEGRWQDVVPKLVAEGAMFDAIYFDTFAEDYKDLREFFSEYVIALLDPDGRFGFFNGLGADRQVCYDVYTKIVEMDLFEAGLDTEWKEIDVSDLDKAGEWEGVRRKYWALPTYRLPVATFIG